MNENPEVMAMVREQLRRRSPPPTAALYGRAVRIDPSIRELSLRQFNARYPLRVWREKARNEKARNEKARKRRPAEGPSGGSRNTVDARPQLDLDRDSVRDVLLRFARDVTAADGTAALIDALSDVDRYVEEIVAATR